MLKAIIPAAGKRTFPHDPTARGYHVVYRENEINHCPGCGRTHWYVGRISAECGFCSTALPLAESAVSGPRGPMRSHRPLFTSSNAA